MADTSYGTLANSIERENYLSARDEAYAMAWGVRKLEEEERGRTRYGLETPIWPGWGAREILSVLYQFQFAGDLGALERQSGMIRQELLEKLNRALIGGANFDGFDQAQRRASQVTLAAEGNGQISVSSRSHRIYFDSTTAVALSLGVKLQRVEAMGGIVEKEIHRSDVFRQKR